MPNTLEEILAGGYGPNLWANRIQRFIERYRTVDGTPWLVDSRGYTGGHLMRGPYTGVKFHYQGRTFEVQVREVK